MLWLGLILMFLSISYADFLRIGGGMRPRNIQLRRAHDDATATDSEGRHGTHEDDIAISIRLPLPDSESPLELPAPSTVDNNGISDENDYEVVNDDDIEHFLHNLDGYHSLQYGRVNAEYAGRNRDFFCELYGGRDPRYCNRDAGNFS